ncbi:MAG: hypothetical protein WCW44_02365 [archaeon]|jgi:hypothetical protein
MSKKKFDNIVLPLQSNNFVGQEFLTKLSLLFSGDYTKKAKDFLLAYSFAIYLMFSLVSFVLILINVLFFPLLVLGLVKVFDSYKFYLIKKDFEENGIF